MSSCEIDTAVRSGKVRICGDSIGSSSQFRTEEYLLIPYHSTACQFFCIIKILVDGLTSVCIIKGIRSAC